MSKIDIFCHNWEMLLMIGYREPDINKIRIIWNDEGTVKEILFTMSGITINMLKEY